MKLTRNQVTSLVIDTALVIPYTAIDKVIRLDIRTCCGAFAAYSLVDVVYDEVVEYIERHHK